MLSGQPWASWQEVAGAQLCLWRSGCNSQARSSNKATLQTGEQLPEIWGAGGEAKGAGVEGEERRNSLKEVLLRREQLASAHLAARVAALNGVFFFFLADDQMLNNEGIFCLSSPSSAGGAERRLPALTVGCNPQLPFRCVLGRAKGRGWEAGSQPPADARMREHSSEPCPPFPGVSAG